jgi:hypothetical protein
MTPEPTVPPAPAQSIKARREIFEKKQAAPDAAVPRKPFRDYLRETPAAPLPLGIKASLSGAGIAVTVLLSAALLQASSQPRHVETPPAPSGEILVSAAPSPAPTPAGAQEAAPSKAPTPPPKPEAQPAPPAPKPEAQQAPPAPKPETQQAPPAPKPEAQQAPPAPKPEAQPAPAPRKAEPRPEVRKPRSRSRIPAGLDKVYDEVKKNQGGKTLFGEEDEDQ